MKYNKSKGRAVKGRRPAMIFEALSLPSKKLIDTDVLDDFPTVSGAEID